MSAVVYSQLHALFIASWSDADRLQFLYVDCGAWYAVGLIHRQLGGLLVERRTSVSQIRGSIPGQVAAV